MVLQRNLTRTIILWAITKDYLEPTSNRNVSKEKIEEIKQQCPHHFRLYDDDDILYYEGYSNDDNSFLPLEWAMYDSGCTRIDYLNPKTNKYETL